MEQYHWQVILSWEQQIPRSVKHPYVNRTDGIGNRCRLFKSPKNKCNPRFHTYIQKSVYVILKYIAGEGYGFSLTILGSPVITGLLFVL